MSDLHFGAENSVLTSPTERPATATDTGLSVDPQRPSPVLSGLIDGLRHLTRDQDRPPALILAGDILDLALSPDETRRQLRPARGVHPEPGRPRDRR
jgi:hypothetical protein